VGPGVVESARSFLAESEDRAPRDELGTVRETMQG
jgi:hypothetical protein